MRTISTTLALALVTSLAACGGAEAPPPETAPVATAAPAATATAAATAEPAKPALSEAEAKKKADAEKLQQDLAKMEDEAKKEAARFTPEIKAEVQKLADAKYPNVKAAIEAVLAGKHRQPGDADRDKHRHPVETLTFFGMKQDSTVLEFGGGGGWYTAVLAPVLAKKGKLLVTALDPSGPADSRNTLYGKRFKYFIDKSPELSGKIQTVILADPNKPDLGAVEGKVDIVLAIREIHGWYTNKRFSQNVGEVYRALKPGGVFGVVAHRAKPDANVDEVAKKGYLPEAWVIQQIEAAGFKLAAKSEVNANPKDTKDYAEGVWTLPPNYRLGDKDRAKYEAIGESDRMTLKFVKEKKKK